MEISEVKQTALQTEGCFDKAGLCPSTTVYNVADWHEDFLLGKSKEQMKTILKTTAALVLTAMTPILEYVLIIGLFIGIVVLFPIAPAPETGAGGIMDIATWALIMVLMPVPLAFVYVFLLGLPAFLIGWYFRAIRWWTTLIASFLIGAIPSTLTVAFIPTGWSGKTYLWQDLNAENLGMMAFAAILMGVFGISGGLVFWLLWRYWVSPASPAGRPLPALANALDAVETQ